MAYGSPVGHHRHPPSQNSLPQLAGEYPMVQSLHPSSPPKSSIKRVLLSVCDAKRAVGQSSDWSNLGCSAGNTLGKPAQVVVVQQYGDATGDHSSSKFKPNCFAASFTTLYSGLLSVIGLPAVVFPLILISISILLCANGLTKLVNTCV